MVQINSGGFNIDVIFENGFCDYCPFRIEEISAFYEDSDYYAFYRRGRCLNNSICSRIYFMMSKEK